MIGAMITEQRVHNTKVHFNRFGWWWAVTLAGLIAMLIAAPQQATVLLYKLLQVNIALLVGYWGDRIIFRNTPPVRPRMRRDLVTASRIVARAIIVLAVVIGLTIGL